MNQSRILPLAVALAVLAACQPKTATTVADNSAPVATVNGGPITRNFYDFYIKGVTGGKAPADLTPAQRTTALDNLIRARLVGDEAVKEGLDKSGDTAYLLELARLNVLQQAVQDQYLKDRKPTEQELRAEYETSLAAMPKTEYHARHILVATEPYAQKVIQRLDKGEKFDALAKEESMDSSKASGGDLGWFTPNRMVPEFSGAVTSLKPGEYTHKPVQTQYGWHVIQLMEERPVTPPSYDQVHQRLEQIVQAKKFRLYTDELMHNAKIERFPDQMGGGGAASGATGAAPAAAASGTQGAAGAAAPGAPASSAPASSPPASSAPASQAPAPSGSPTPPKN